MSNSIVITEAKAVLAELGKPVHYRELTERILNRGVWKTTGKTPQNTVNAQISTSISRGDKEIRALGGGLYALNTVEVGAITKPDKPKKAERESEPVADPKPPKISVIAPRSVDVNISDEDDIERDRVIAFQEDCGQSLIMIARMLAGVPKESAEWYAFIGGELIPQRVSPDSARYAFKYYGRLAYRHYSDALRAALTEAGFRQCNKRRTN